MNNATLPSGTLSYRESGAGQPLVFLHGFLQDGRVWDPVTTALSSDFRCITPTLPLGAHRRAMHPDADVSVAGVATVVAEFLDALDLRDVTLVGNDTGGAIAQFVAARHPKRLARLVLTSCEAFENYIPAPLRSLPIAARAGVLAVVISALRLRAVRRLPSGYGWLTNTPLPDALIDEWVAAYRADSGVRRDANAFIASLGDREQMNEVAVELAHFDRPALIAWAANDKLFAPEHATRLAAVLPHSQLAFIENSRTWVMRDQPALTAQLIRAFASEPAALRRTPASGEER